MQAGVLVVVGLHELLLDQLNEQEIALGIPSPLISSLLLVPVVYAALSFGVSGAVSTAVWASILLTPHWYALLRSPQAQSHLWIELVNMVVLIAVAVVVGQRVSKEEAARHRAESALREASKAQTRYQGLFDGQPAPVIVTDGRGVVVELNTAATALLGPLTARPVETCLGMSVSSLKSGDTPVTLRHETEDRVFQPRVEELAFEDGTSLVQICLTDVTDHRRREEEERAFSSRLLAVQEEERRRLAQDLHDEPLQQLMFLARTLEDLAEDPALDPAQADLARRGRASATDASGQLRTIIHGLRPPVLDDLGLVPALRQLAERTQSRGAVKVSLYVSGDQRRLPPELELTAYRIVQECLTNVIRHAQASRVTVSVAFADPVIIVVHDDGQGIHRSRESRPRSEGGLGLLGIEERATMAGGSSRVRSGAKSGTTVRVTLPVGTSDRDRTRGAGNPAKPVLGDGS